MAASASNARAESHVRQADRNLGSCSVKPLIHSIPSNGGRQTKAPHMRCGPEAGTSRAKGPRMMSFCESQRPSDPPAVLDRVREGLPLVNIICHQLRRQIGSVVRMDDIVSYGREGLLAAARSFDPMRGVPFRRWANIRVRGS